LSKFDDPLFFKTLERYHRIVSASSIGSIPNRVLITGAMGQLGRALGQVLCQVLGPERVLLTDICRRPGDFPIAGSAGPAFRYLNILDPNSLEQIVVDEQIDMLVSWLKSQLELTINTLDAHFEVHFSALLSALGEQNVDLALQVNCQGVQVKSHWHNYCIKISI
jgi:threonine 3-dehydrogenase